MPNKSEKDVSKFLLALDKIKRKRSDVIKSLKEICDAICEEAAVDRFGNMVHSSTGLVGEAFGIAGIALSP